MSYADPSDVANVSSAGGGGGGGSGSFGTGGSIAGTALSVMGQIYGGKAQQNMYNYQAQVKRQEAEIARQKAHRDIMAGEVRAQQAGLVGAANISRQNVREAAGNVSLTGASATGIRMSQLGETQETERIARTNAAEMAYGQDVKAAGYEAEAGQYTTAAQTAKQAMVWDVAASVVGGATNVADKWQQASMYEAPPTVGG
jgi:hypothetical protein